MTFPADTTPIASAPAGTETLGGSTPTHTEHHDLLTDALNAVTLELGANPSGPEVDVAARFTAVEGDVATLQTDVAALPGGDSRVFDVVSYGAAVDGATDDTAAVQAAIDAWAASGFDGVVTSSKSGVSIIGGALQDTTGANAQILLPAIDAVDTEQRSLRFGGLTPPPTVVSVIGTTPTPDGSWVLKSTLASGTGAVIGAQGPAGTYLGFTNLHLELRNLTVRTVSNPTITALDLRQVASVDLDGVVVDCGSYYVGGLTEPTSTGSYGIRLPKSNNGAHVRLGMVDVVGFYTGFEFAEHATGVKVAAWGCKVAAEFDATNHASVFLRFMAVWCERGIKFTGAHAVDVWQLDIEHAASGWMTTDYDIDDASNYGLGFVRWWAVLAGTGPHDVFTVNGATGITTSRVGAAIGSGGGGSSDYVYRDRLVAAVGNNVLTLGATPVANSPLVWVNGAIKWPGTDYTISGAVITFGTALAAADVVAVQYHSTASTAAASALSGGSLSIADSFTRADSTSTMGTTSTGSKAWTALAGTWGIATDKGYLASAPSGGLAFAVVDSTVADCTISTVITAAGSPGNCGLALRATDASNLYIVEILPGSSFAPQIYKRVGGTVTSIATGAAVTFAVGDTLSAVLVGNSITVKRNGTTIVSVTDSTHPSATKHGLYNYHPVAGAPGTARFDDLSITA